MKRFSQQTVDELLVACERRCCVCHEMKGVNLEVHHIVPVAEGGDSSRENAIALCFDCHAQIGHYNVQHPRGRRFTPNELRRRRDRLIARLRQPLYWELPALLPYEGEPDLDELIHAIRTTEAWRAEAVEQLYPRLLALGPEGRGIFLAETRQLLERDDTDASWGAARAVEFLTQWEPAVVPDSLLWNMAEHKDFSVRSSAAVAYYWLALCSPERVPILLMGKLASYYEDWYVMTPATSALIRLARARPVAIDMLARELTDPDKDARNHSAGALRRLGREWPAAVREDVGELMQASSDPAVKAVGDEWLAYARDRRPDDGKPLDSYMF